MMKKTKLKLTLDKPVTYHNKPVRELSDNWAEWIEGMTISVET